MNINELLSKISFKTIRWDYSFSLFDIYLRDKNTFWGFSVFTLSGSRRRYSLLELIVILPNMSNYRNLIWWSFDLFFLKNWVSDVWEGERERLTWSKEYRDKTIFGRFAQKIKDSIK